MNNTKISVTLPQAQREIVELAIKGRKDLQIFDRIGRLQLTADNVLEIRALIAKIYTDKFQIKTKSGDNLAFCFTCEQLLGKIDLRLPELGLEAPDEEAINDGENAVISVPSRTVPVKENKESDNVVPFTPPVEEKTTDGLDAERENIFNVLKGKKNNV